MNGPIDQINNIMGSSIYHAPAGRAAKSQASSIKTDIVKNSSKYIVENKKIVFERYDRYGKLISRIPWSAHPISEKA
jgi:hypothetical protein